MADDSGATTAKAIAEAAGAAMYGSDRAARALGIHLLEIAPGLARMRMTVRADMINGHGVCHGGMTFTLADTTLAYASNSYNQNALAHTIQITFLKPAFGGDTLTATAQETAVSGRTGIYDVRVVNQHGETLAIFRGQTQTVKGQPVPGQPVTREM